MTNDESYTLQVLAYNHNGDGAGTEAIATPTATDTAAPTLLGARADGATLRLIWNEALDESSEPGTTAFTVNVGGVVRGTDQVSVSGNVVTLSLASVVNAGQTVTVGYSAPSGPTASPLRDAAMNNVADFSAQTVRNDTTRVAITSDPGPDMTYILRNGFGRQDMIDVTVTFSERVLVKGVPQLMLQVGEAPRPAPYRSGSGTTSLIFRYTLAEGETDADGISVPAGAIQTAGLIRYASTKAVAPAQVELAGQSAHLVDAVRPALLSANGLLNRSVLTLTWDKALDESSVPTPRGVGFTVRDTSNNTIREISTILVHGKVVTLALSSAISSTDQLRVSYGVPFKTYNPLKDTLGNYAGTSSAVVSVTQRPNSEPEFPTSEDGARSVDENTPANTNIGNAVAADDADNDALTYSISGTDADFFDVVATSGQLRTKAALNREFRDSYTLTMSVHDGRDTYSNADTAVDDTISVTVTVDDVDEPADISFTASGGVTENNNALIVDENHNGPLATFSASDPENKPGLTYTWSPGGGDRGSFTITEAGVLSFSNIPDYERPGDSGGNNVYNTGVDVRDSDNKLGFILFTVAVRPVNEPPAITGDDSPTFNENANITNRLARYTATDPEGDTVTLSLAAGGADFSLASNGVLTFKASPDFEEQSTYSATVRAVAGSHTVNKVVTVNIQNVEEPGTITLSTVQPQEGTLLTATLEDDDGPTGTTWQWYRTSSRGSTGAVITNANSRFYTPVADDVGSYLRAVASYDDGHGDDKSATAVSANRVQEAPLTPEPPVFPADGDYDRSIRENLPAGRNVGAPVSTTDGNNDRLTYTIATSNYFEIVDSTGQLRTKAELDHEDREQHFVTVTATDPGGLTDTVSVTITVEDVDETPVVSGPTSPEVAENGNPGVATYTTTDPDLKGIDLDLSGSRQ